MVTRDVPEPLYLCALCRDTGWQWVMVDGKAAVRACSSGCEVPSKADRIARTIAAKGVY